MSDRDAVTYPAHLTVAVLFYLALVMLFALLDVLEWAEWRFWWGARPWN